MTASGHESDGETGHPKNKGGQTETGSNVPQGKVHKESSFRSKGTGRPQPVTPTSRRAGECASRRCNRERSEERDKSRRQWPRRAAVSEETRGDHNSHRTNARMRRSERTERTDWAAPSSEEPEATSDQTTRPVKSNPGERATTNPG